jgi:hypothetical protein
LRYRHSSARERNRPRSAEGKYTEIGEMLQHLVKASADYATKDDLKDLATKEQVLALQTQVNSIEQQLRATRTEQRLGDLEEEVFGAPRK